MTTKTNRGRAFTTDAAPKHTATTDVAVAEEPARKAVSTQVDYGDDVGAGLEGVTSSEMLIPFLRMIQPTSPQLDPTSPAYDEDAKGGMIVHTASGEFYPALNSGKQAFPGVGFIPAFRDTSFTEWVPKVSEGGQGPSGGGFRGSWDANDPRIAQMKKEQGAYKKLKTPDGTELVETYSVYGVVVPRAADGTWLTEDATQGVISFTSTQIKKYRLLLTRLMALVGTPPRFPIWCWRWNLTTVPESNKHGSYFGWRLTLDGETAKDAQLLPTDNLYLIARELNHLVKAGAARADFATSDVGSDDAKEASGGFAGTTVNPDGEDIPF